MDGYKTRLKSSRIFRNSAWGKAAEGYGRRDSEVPVGYEVPGTLKRFQAFFYRV